MKSKILVLFLMVGSAAAQFGTGGYGGAKPVDDRTFMQKVCHAVTFGQKCKTKSILRTLTIPITPNISLYIPLYGTANWSTYVNANSSLLDLLLSGNATLPALLAGSIQTNGLPPHTIQLPPENFSVLVGVYPCNSGNEGMWASVNDSTVNTWGSTITGGGSFHEPAYCDGTNWTVR
jgi:hypothetical protein